MMEMNAEATASVLENILKHGKFNIPTRNAMENAVRLLKPVPEEMEGGGNIWFTVCGVCHTLTIPAWDFCPYCGRGIKRGVI